MKTLCRWWWLLLLISVFTLLLNNKKPVSLCLTLPKNNGECMFSQENIWKYDRVRVSRFERNIDFGRVEGNDWRLSGFNDLKFDIYNQENGDLNWNVWDRMRKERNYPFKAIFIIKSEELSAMAEKLKVSNLDFRVSYKGKLNDGEYFEDGNVRDLAVDRDKDFRLSYQNYTCVDDSGDCLEDVSKVKSIKHDDASLYVTVKNNKGDYIDLGTVNGIGVSFYIVYFDIGLILVLLFLMVVKLTPLLFELLRNYKLGNFINFIFYFVSIFVFVKVLAFIYLKYYPHSFVAEYFPFIKYALVAIMFLYTFEYLWEKIVGLHERVGSKLFVGIFAMVIVSLYILSCLNGYSFRPESIYYSAGFDQLTYYSWSRDILRDKTFFIESTVVYSKPFFLYFKALMMMVFGDDNKVMDTFSHWMLLSLPLMFIIAFLIRLKKSGRTIKERLMKVFGVELILLLTVYWNFMMNGWFIRFIENISEMPAWFFMGAATCLVPFVGKEGDKKVIKAISIFVGLSLLMRTTMIIYLPILLFGMLIMFKSFGWKLIKKLLPIGIGLGLSGLLILIHSKLGVITSNGVNKYFSDNTSISIGLFTIFERWHKLVPTGYELFIWVILIFSLIVNTVIVKRLNRIILFIGVIFITLIFELPMLSEIYGNRGLFWLYWMLSYLSAILILDAVHASKDSDNR